MTWSGAAFLAVLFVIVLWIWHRGKKRVHQARVEPLSLRPRKRPDELWQELVRYCSDHPALNVSQPHGLLFVHWRLPGHYDAAAPLERTYAVEMKMGPGGRTIYARYGEGTIDWERAVDGHVHGPFVDWVWDLAPRLVRPLYVGEHPPEPTEHGPHTLEGLVLPLQEIVLRSGYAWEPTVEFESGHANAPEHKGAVEPATPEPARGEPRG